MKTTHTNEDVPAVSVIMNVYNGERYLRPTLEAILAQTFTDFELVFFDDASTDDSCAIAESYRDPRIRLVHAEHNLGLGKARDAAITHARAPWLAFCDHDDIWLPHKLEVQAPLTRDERVGLVYGRTVTMKDGVDVRDFDHRHEYAPLPRGEILGDLLRDSCYIAMCSAMLRTKAVRDLGPVPENVRVSPDYWYYLNICREYRAEATDQVVCRYRVHERNMTWNTGSQMHSEVLWMLDRLGGAAPDALVRRRRRVHASLVAYHSARSEGGRLAGLKTLLRSGSFGYLLSRPFARTARAVKRRIVRPMWRRAPVELDGARDDPATPILGSFVSAVPFERSVQRIAALVDARRPAYVCAANAYALTVAERDSAHQAIVNRAAFLTADGAPLVWLQRALGADAERVHNDDLVLECMRRFEGWRHYLVGGREGQAEEARRALGDRFPGVAFVGADATPRRPVPPERTDEIVERIRAARADIVWVGMGTPAQDFWMHTACARAGVPMVGCGSLFDLVTGRTRRAPAVVQKAGLQWLFRLVQEPRRLARRYAVYNTLFVTGVARQLLFERSGRRARRGADPIAREPSA